MIKLNITLSYEKFKLNIILNFDFIIHLKYVLNNNSIIGYFVINLKIRDFTLNSKLS